MGLIARLQKKIGAGDEQPAFYAFYSPLKKGPYSIVANKSPIDD